MLARVAVRAAWPTPARGAVPGGRPHWPERPLGICSPAALPRIGGHRHSLSVMSPRPWAYSRSRSLVTSSFSSRISLLLGSSLMTALQRICLARSAYLGSKGNCGLGALSPARGPGRPPALQPEGPMGHTCAPLLIKDPHGSHDQQVGANCSAHEHSSTGLVSRGPWATRSPKLHPKVWWERNRAHEDSGAPERHSEPQGVTGETAPSQEAPVSRWCS